MTLYRTKAAPLPGTSYADLAPLARALLRSIARRTKRRPYIRSVYFRKDKIFFTHFWAHLAQRSPGQRARRLKYLPCALELVRKSRHEPNSKENPNRQREILHRFAGLTPDGEKFMVQIKEDKKTNRKELMSVFPYQ